MKRNILTTILLISTFMLSAQNFMIVTNVNKAANGNSMEMENFTDRMGIGYHINKSFIVGLQSAGGNNGYDIFFRYLWQDDIYLSVNMSNEDKADNMNIGIGYSLNIFNNFYVEPNYNIPFSEDEEGERKGDINLGLSYRF